MRIYGGEFYGCKDSPAGGVDSSAVQICHGMCRLARYAPCPCFQFDWAPSGLPKPCEVPENHHGVITAARPRFVGGGHSLSRSLSVLFHDPIATTYRNTRSSSVTVEDRAVKYGPHVSGFEWMTMRTPRNRRNWSWRLGFWGWCGVGNWASGVHYGPSARRSFFFFFFSIFHSQINSNAILNYKFI
jgi:hypothetical protein